MTRPTIHLFADVLGGYGGIETYLDALARRLASDGWPIRIAVSLNAPAPFLDELEALGITVYRQPRVPGDRWHVRRRLLVLNVARQIAAGDWVYCVRQPMPEIYVALVRAVHRRGGKVAASWALAPEFLPPPPGAPGERFVKAIKETDAVISVAECTKHQFREVYGYDGTVAVVRYHNAELFPKPVNLPPGPPYRIGYIGRIDIAQKNLDTVIAAFGQLASRRNDVILNMHGGGPDIAILKQMASAAGLGDRIKLYGAYDHRRDLAKIIAANHLFIYPSRFEGGPCLTLIELLQAGRYVIASPVGGIPDIYEDRHDIGELVPPNDEDAIAKALERGLDRIADGVIDAENIRAVYREHFSEAIAHQQFLSALGLMQPNVGTHCG